MFDVGCRVGFYYVPCVWLSFMMAEGSSTHFLNEIWKKGFHFFLSPTEKPSRMHLDYCYWQPIAPKIIVQQRAK
jgi:hypothetical protein